MKRYQGGELASGGFYWHLANWDAAFVPRGGAPLPGSSTDRYMRIPVAIALLAAPVMGGLFVVFLPFIGVALMLKHLGEAAVAASGEMVEWATARARPVLARMSRREERHDDRR